MKLAVGVALTCWDSFFRVRVRLIVPATLRKQRSRLERRRGCVLQARHPGGFVVEKGRGMKGRGDVVNNAQGLSPSVIQY